MIQKQAFVLTLYNMTIFHIIKSHVFPHATPDASIGEFFRLKNDMETSSLLSKIQEWEASQKGQTSAYDYEKTFDQMWQELGKKSTTGKLRGNTF
jgi:hypothetical protein